MVRLLFSGTRQLRADHQRHIELLGHDLQAAGDFRHLLHAVVGLFGRMHQLQVIDHHEAEVLDAAQPRLHLRHRNAGGIVEEDRRIVQHAGRRRNAAPLVRGQIAHPQLFARHPRFGGKQTVDQLLAGHFQRKHRHRALLLHRHVARDIEHKAGFAHAGTRADDNQVGAVEAGGHRIERRDAGRDAHIVAALTRGELVEHLEVGGQHLGNRQQPALLAVLPDIVDFLFCRIQQQRRLDRRIHRILGNLPRRLDELAHVGLFPDDPGIVADIGYRGHHLRELEQIPLAVFAGKKAVRLERFEHRDEVDRLGFHHLAAHHPVNCLMLGQIELLRAQAVRDHLIQTLRLHQHRTEHRLFRFRGIRQVHPVGIGRILLHRHSMPFGFIRSP